MTTSGWTSVTKRPDARVVYVSSSTGSDSADGLSPTKPKRTISAGKALLRDGYPDWLLLKNGDTWNEGLGQWTKSGVSITEPMIVSRYGPLAGERPRLQPPSGQDAFAAFKGNLHHLALVDLHFSPQDAGTGNGVSWTTGGGWLLVEGCLIEGFDMAVVLQGGGNFFVRRNVMADLATSGMYVRRVGGLLVEENVIDRCGIEAPSIFKHGIYLDNEGNTGMIVQGNIISNTSSHGLQLRPGGIALDNLFVRTAIAIQLGGGDSWQANPNGVNGLISQNVILDGKDIDENNGRGWGILLQNVNSALINGNVIANTMLASNPRPIELDGWNNGNRVHGVSLANNIVYGWGGSTVRVKGRFGSEIKALSVYANDFQNTVDASWLMEIDAAESDFSSAFNRFSNPSLLDERWFHLGGVTKTLAEYKAAVGDTSSFASEVAYVNPHVSLAGYHAGGSHDAFMAEARKQSKANWRTTYTAAAVNAWVRAGFEAPA